MGKSDLTIIRTKNFILKLKPYELVSFSYNGKEIGVPSATIPTYLEKATSPVEDINGFPKVDYLEE